MPNEIASSSPCPHCQAANFAANKTCKKCGGLMDGRASANLTPCPDCRHYCSIHAEVCPNCGRGLRTSKSNSGIPLIPIGIAGLILVGAGYFALPALFSARREVAVQQAVISGEPAKAGISDRNLAASKAALNAIGEIDSVTAVGTSYAKYRDTLQSARIKYDAALRDMKPLDEAEFSILKDLDEAFKCYMDAGDAWREFIEEGSKHGFLSTQNVTVSSLESTYGFRATSQFGYFNSEVLQTIWRAGNEKFNKVATRLRGTQ